MRIRTIPCSFVMPVFLPTLACALTVETSKSPEGVETTKQSSFRLFFGEKHQEIGYLTIAIGALICLSSLIGFWRKSKQQGLVIQGESGSANIKMSTSYEVALLLFGAFLSIFGLFVARLQFVYGLTF